MEDCTFGSCNSYQFEVWRPPSSAKGLREVPLSYPVKYAKFKFSNFSDLRQIRLIEQRVLIYAQQCCKNHSKNLVNHIFWFVFEHTETLSFPPKLHCLLTLYKGSIVKNVFYKKKEAYGKHLSFVTLGSYVTCSGAKVRAGAGGGGSLAW